MTTIRPMTPDDWDAVRRIYAEGIATGNATFETQTPEWEAWDRARRPDCRLVICDERGAVIGFAALSPTSSRPAYAGVAEHSIYVAASARGTGTGTALLRALIDASEAAGIWTLQSSIFPENTASYALHRRCGFREVGRRERIARMNGVWRDTLLIERRSPNVGT
jgi:phosphinothricin acetyltransferase